MSAVRELSWTPRRFGDRYCAPACGYGCTKAQYDKAMQDAVALAKRLGPGWKPRVWENLGWHYEVTKGAARIRPNMNKLKGHPWTVDGYWCSIESASQFTADAATPEDALGFALQDARGAQRKIAADCSDLLP